MFNLLSSSNASNTEAFDSLVMDSSNFVFPNSLGYVNDDFYWSEFPGFLTESFNNTLRDSYPQLSFFDKHVGIDRGNARSHDRFYLSLGDSKYHRDRSIFSWFTKKRGSVHVSSLGKSWQLFIQILQGPEYRSFVDKCLKTSDYDIRFAWHMGFSGAEICPHLDNSLKLGTHIFYFNSVLDWKPEWGGQTVILVGPQNDSECPEFDAFTTSYEVSNIGNNSLFFRNSPSAWHGVRPLQAPAETYRRIFTVVFDTPKINY